MTIDEAKEALKQGKKVRHKSWYKKAFLTLKQEVKVVDLFDENREEEDIFDRFTADDWEIFKDGNWNEEE